MTLINVQIVGLFNSGTNLVAKLVSAINDKRINIHGEGHTMWWKHSFVSEEIFRSALKKTKNGSSTYFIVVVKRPDWWIRSMKKASYTLEIAPDKSCKLNPPNLRPNDKFISPKKEYEFENLESCWEKFYKQAFSILPSSRTLIVRYIDVLYDLKKVIDDVCVKLKLDRKPDVNAKAILSRPSKKTGNTTFGDLSKIRYPKDEEIDSSINIDEELLEKLKYYKKTVEENV